MQFAADVDIADALAAPSVVIKPYLEIDWNRNGLYTHLYSNMSNVVESVVVDFAAIRGNLPEEIQTINGSSSGQMTVVLSGQRNAGELRAAQIFSEYYTSSPLTAAGVRIKGAPIRYTRQIKTKAGFRKIRQFTGWITDLKISEDSDQVTLTCSDVDDLKTKLVSLPLWAVGPSPDNAKQANSQGKLSREHPINPSWVWNEVLTQAGREMWPKPRADSIAAWSCSGSMLPSKGSLFDASIALHEMSWEGYSPGPIGAETHQNWCDISGPYGMALFPSSRNNDAEVVSGTVRATALAGTPQAGGSGTASYIGMSGWVKSFTGPGIPAGTPSTIGIVMGSSYSSPAAGRFWIQLQQNGDVYIILTESSASGGPNAGTMRTWQYPGAMTQNNGWQFVSCHINFNAASVSASLQVNNVGLVAAVTPSPLTGFTVAEFVKPEEQTPECFITVGGCPIQHAQVFRGGGIGAFNAASQRPNWATAGTPRPAVTTYSDSALYWIPDTYSKYAWDVLKDVVGAELSSIFTDEFGVVRIYNRDDLQVLAMIALYGGINTSYYFANHIQSLWLSYLYPSAADVPTPVVDTMTKAKIRAIELNPSEDTYRNTIIVNWTKAQQVRDIVWSSPDAKLFFAPSGSTNLLKEFGVNGIVSIFPRAFVVSATPSSNPPILNQTSVSAVYAPTPGTVAPAGWLTTVGMYLNQRKLWVAYGAGILSFNHYYIGAMLGADQSNLKIGGLKYESDAAVATDWYLVPEVAARGTVMIEWPSSSWVQHPMEKISNSFLYEVVKALPVIPDLTVPVDPRRQLTDVIKLPSSDLVSGSVYAQVIGKRISDTQNSASDKVDLRVITVGGVDAYWDDDSSGWDIGSWTP